MKTWFSEQTTTTRYIDKYGFYAVYWENIGSALHIHFIFQFGMLNHLHSRTECVIASAIMPEYAPVNE